MGKRVKGESVGAVPLCPPIHLIADNETDLYHILYSVYLGLAN